MQILNIRDRGKDIEIAVIFKILFVKWLLQKELKFLHLLIKLTISDGLIDLKNIEEEMKQFLFSSEKETFLKLLFLIFIDICTLTLEKKVLTHAQCIFSQLILYYLCLQY